MGESPLTQNQSTQACQEAIEQIKQELDQATRVQTPGGVFEVQWSNEGKATAIGQLAFFAEFLQASGLLRIPMNVTADSGHRDRFRCCAV